VTTIARDPKGQTSGELHYEVVCKTEGDWLWYVTEHEGDLLDCGHESSLDAAMRGITDTMEKSVRDKLLAARDGAWRAHLTRRGQ